ncbi:hypothetical protein PS627_03098 [Pseudomonas fluorescens]|uniref:hypothetical protein n=1 Tax=Pseudomonas fluorescens TaxID=294 RepID=UPI001259A41E|nr:hypothetical protein [Pseudomonas fluorescens]CAG8868717.1 hypothetical protein PS627_03098 [Pseudomonas fluorescens]VVP68676.1 hypothetical protein PS910_00411 [Pseudomonas fluorescens]
MHDEDDIHEPEHDHLLDHEFHEREEQEPDASSFEDALDEEEDEALADELDGMDHPAWHDDVE